MKRSNLIGFAVVVSMAAGLLAGCNSGGGMIARVTDRITKTDGGKVYVVATDKTAFYRHGPKQGNGPDSELPKDTLVSLIRNSFGFSKVQLASSGEQGFVSSEDIMPASPTVLAALTAPKPDPIVAAATSSSSSAPENFDVRSTDPGAVPPPEALPPPDLPPAAAEPTPQ
jgi:hypothetical protein